MDKTLVFALVAALASAGYSAPAGDSWENRPTAARNDRADRWWCDTWRMGDHVETKYAYQFTGRLTASPETAGNVRWWQFVNKYIDREMSAEISGSSEATTDVLMGVGPKGEPLPPGVDVQLRRTYGSPMSYRGLAVVGPTNGLEMEKMLRTAIVAFVDQVDDPKVQEKVEALAQMATPGVVSAVLDNLQGLAELADAAWIGEAVKGLGGEVNGTAKLAGEAFDAVMDWLRAERAKSLEKLAGGSLDSNGIEAKSKGWFYLNFRSRDLDKLSNMAASFNELFSYSCFYICGRAGEPLFAKKVAKDGPARDLLANCDDFAALPQAMRKLPLTADDTRARNIIARESLDVNAKLFGLRERRPGDFWLVDASLLDGFLHQDLTGGFRGTVIMNYVGDEKISPTMFDRTVNARVFTARHLKMVREHRGKFTNFKYEEPGSFAVEYDPRNNADKNEAELDLYVDTASGHIVKVRANFATSRVRALPKLGLADGFTSAEGQVTFKIDAETNPTSVFDRRDAK